MSDRPNTSGKGRIRIRCLSTTVSTHFYERLPFLRADSDIAVAAAAVLFCWTAGAERMVGLADTTGDAATYTHITVYEGKQNMLEKQMFF